MDFAKRDEILQRLERELEMLALKSDLMQKNCDRSNRLGLKEVSAFESGLIYAYQYTSEVLIRLINVINGSDDSDNV